MLVIEIFEWDTPTLYYIDLLLRKKNPNSSDMNSL